MMRMFKSDNHQSRWKNHKTVSLCIKLFFFCQFMYMINKNLNSFLIWSCFFVFIVGYKKEHFSDFSNCVCSSIFSSHFVLINSFIGDYSGDWLINCGYCAVDHDVLRPAHVQEFEIATMQVWALIIAVLTRILIIFFFFAVSGFLVKYQTSWATICGLYYL